MRTLASASLLLLALALAAERPAHAAPPPPEAASGHVLGLDGADIVVDLGEAKGARDGALVELWRPLKLRHPITGKVLEDRFRIGALRVQQARRTLSLARAEGTLARTVAPGDVVILVPEPGAERVVATEPTAAAPTTSVAPDATASPASPAAPAQAASPAAPADAEASELARAMDELRGKDPVARITAYEDYVRKHPRGRFAHVLYEEAQALRRAVEPSARRAATAPARISLALPDEALAGAPLELALEVAGAKGVLLHVRGARDVSYRTQPMTRAGADYYRATVAAEAMRAPRIYYFLEAVDADGASSPLVATADAPVELDVRPPPKAPALRPGDATVALWTDYADYNRLKGNDRVWQSEGWFGLRLDDVGLRAVRSGFGVFRGVGGSLRELDGPVPVSRSVGLTYGWLEGEVAPSANFALLGRGIVGLREDGISWGAQGHLRIGNDRRTNLLLGGEVLGGVGMRATAELQWNTLPRFPIVLRTEVSNQPAGVAQSPPAVSKLGVAPSVAYEQGELAARAIVQVGYRVVPSLVVSGRVSYEGRTVWHAGPGFGAGVMYAW